MTVNRCMRQARRKRYGLVVGGGRIRVNRLPASMREIPHFTIGKKQPYVLPSFEIVHLKTQAHGRPVSAGHRFMIGHLPMVDTSQNR